MHFSAKRGIAIAFRLSVCLSVRLSACGVGELWSHRLEFFENNFSPLVNMGCSLFATPTWRVCSKGNIPLYLGPKWPTPYLFERRRHSIANCGRMVADSATVTIESHRKLPSLFLMMSSLTPMTSPSTKMGFHMPHPTYANGHISATGDPISTSCLVLGWGFWDGGSNGAIYGSNKSKMVPAAMLEKFQMVACSRRNRSSDPLHILF